MKKTYIKFYTGLIIPLLLAAAYFSASARLLESAGEYLPMEEVISKISDTYGYYGPALAQKTFYYKEHLYRRVKPEAAALGSSRVLQFRGESFRVPFTNIGGMSGLEETIEIAHDLFPANAPRLLILGVDFWWFNPANDGIKPKRSPEDARMTVADLLQPAAWLVTGKISPGEATDIVSGDIPDVGISAITRKDGFDRFGAYHYTSLWTGDRESDDAHFKNSLGRIDKGAGVFIHGGKASEAGLKKFAAFLDELAAKKIHVVLFLPPLAPTVLDAMGKNGGYAYMHPAEKAVRDMALRRKIPFFDFHDIRALDSNDCEFTDGIHAGQAATDRMLLRLAIGDGEVRKAVRLPETAAEILRGKGRASLLDDGTDLLQLGCAEAGKKNDRE
jgi:hypothetical protein